MQHGWAGVLQNTHARLQQLLVVGTLRHVRQELVTLLAHNHGGFNTGVRGVRECLQQGLFGHEVGRADGDTPLGIVDQVVDEAQVVFSFKTGAGGNNLGAHPILVVGDGGVNFCQNQLVRFGVPVGDENGVELFNDGAGAGEGQVLPFQTLLDVFR